MTLYRTHIETRVEGYIHHRDVAKIIETEIRELLGREGRYIKDGVIYESNYRYTSDDEIGKATEEEVKKYEALRLVHDHFYFKNVGAGNNEVGNSSGL